MKIEKVLNNNVVVALDENGAETVLMGRGLGFGRRAGDEAPPDKIEKRFTLHSDQLSDRFQQLITSIPLPHFLMSERIINHAKIALGKELSDSIYVTLPDHISAAVNRYKEGIVLPNPLLWDIRQLYKDEFRVGLKANEIVKEETGVEFTDDEAAFIALHFVNAQLGGEIRDIYDMTYLLQAVFRIVLVHRGSAADSDRRARSALRDRNGCAARKGADPLVRHRLDGRLLGVERNHSILICRCTFNVKDIRFLHIVPGEGSCSRELEARSGSLNA